MKIKWKTLLLCVLTPIVLGAIVGFISSGSMKAFESLDKPPLSPAGWIFPVVWSILYILMGISSYLIISSNILQEEKFSALKIYTFQLIFNLLWSILFFNFKLYSVSFIWLIILWVLIVKTIIVFRPISKIAAYFLIPYLIWVSFAAYLNLGIAMLN